MTKYNTLNVKLSNSQPNKLQSGIKNRTEVTINLSPNLIGSSNDEINFGQKLLLTDTQVSNIHKAFANGLSANIKFSKTQYSKTELGGFAIFDSIKPFKKPDKIVNRAEELFNKKVSINDIIKTANSSRNALKNL